MWPESEVERARHRLSVTLHLIRKALGGGAVVSVGDDLRLNPAVIRTDVVEFLTAMAADDLDRAVELYAGPLLDGFHVQDAGMFERWLDGEQDRFQHLYADALETLAGQAEETGDTARSLQLWRKLAAHDPYSSRVAVRLMQTLEAAGDRPHALRHAQIHATMVRRDLQAEPAPEVLALAEALKKRDAERGRAPDVAPPAVATGETPEAGMSVPESRPVAPGVAVDSGPGASRRRLVIGLAGAVGLLALAGAGLLSGWRSPDSDAEGTLHTPVPQRILVTVFENQTGDPALDPLGFMAADWITEGLAKTGLLEVISTRSALRIPLEDVTGLQDDQLRNQSLLDLADQSGAGTVVWGGYYASEDSLRLNANVSNAATGSLLGSLSVSASTDSPLGGVEELRERVVGLLAARFDPRLASWASTAVSPPRYDAYLAFVAGAREDEREARISHFRRAYSLDTTFVTPLIQALFLVNNMEEPRADTLIRILERSEDRLGPADRLEVQGLRAFMDGDRVSAYQAVRQAAELSPDRFLDAASLAWAAGLRREAAEIWGKDPPRVWRRFPWMSYVSTLHALGEHEEALGAARQARSEDAGARRPYYMVTGTLAALGRVDELRDVVQAALQLPTLSGMSRADFLYATGAELMWHGQPVVGLELLAGSVPRQREEVEQDPESERLRQRLARTLIYLDRPEEALEVLAPLLSDAAPPWPTSVERFTYQLAGVATARLRDSVEVERLVDVLRDTDWVAEMEETTEVLVSPGLIMLAQAVQTRAAIAAAAGTCEEAARLQAQAASIALEGWSNPVWQDIPHQHPAWLTCRDDPAFAELVTR
jgi:DNA-binding SARP family transcriptional activator/TolB-like protein